MAEFDPPRIILRFHTNIDVPKDPATVLEKSDPPRWRRLVEEVGEVRLEPVFSAVEPDRLRELQLQAARRDPSYRAEPLDRFYYVDVPRAQDLEAVARQLREWASVRSVEIEVVGPDPLVNSTDDPRATTRTISMRRRPGSTRGTPGLSPVVTGPASASSTWSAAGLSTTRISPPTASP
jgi:hypothetical protein